MILVTHKHFFRGYIGSKNRIASETYRLISIVSSQSNFYAICERLSDEIVPNNCAVTKFKGDFESIDINNLRIIKNTDPIEDEMERQAYLKELNILVKG